MEALVALSEDEKEPKLPFGTDAVKIKQTKKGSQSATQGI